MRLAAAIPILTVGMAATIAAAALPGMAGVPDPERAHNNWMLKCQGCHRPGAEGGPDRTPAMAGRVARFLSVPGGRDYLARVPGVATTVLPDDELAELINWMLARYDPQHIPPGFQPYTPAEVGTLRRTPLRTEAAVLRARLLTDLRAQEDAHP